MPANLLDLETPCLLLDEQRLRANVARMKAHLAPLGVAFRPHLKTAKSLDVARIAMISATGPATVSTLREAEYFAAGGVRDMIYAVGIAPAKLARVSAIRATGADLAVILDSLEQADAVAAHAARTGEAIPALIEVDADGHRSGVAPTDAATLVAIGKRLVAGGATLRGVLLHAGDSYALNDPAAIADCGRSGTHCRRDCGERLAQRRSALSRRQRRRDTDRALCARPDRHYRGARRRLHVRRSLSGRRQLG
ncbi:D-serine deaminase-like pyridoxal phosphate-dependent protein [Bradyrhizobium japonicum]